MSLLAIDAGTTGVTALLYDDQLSPRARAYRELPQHFPAPGWVEHDADELRRALDQVLAELASRGDLDDLNAVGIANQRETVFALERTTGRALRRGIVWQDRRTAARCRELVARGDDVWLREHTGLLVDPYFSATKIEWMLREDAALAARARAGEVVFATVDAVVREHLAGDRRWLSEPTNASRTQLFHIDERRWDSRALALFGVQAEWLPEVRKSGGDFGQLDTRHLGRAVPIRAMLGDQQSALFGQGCWRAGELKATYGTGLFVLLNAGGKRPASRGGLLVTLAVDGAGEPCYALEGSAFQGGSIVQWLRDELGLLPDAAASEALAREVDDSGGVVLVPAFTGLGAPYWAPDARGALLGLTRGTRRAHLVRAGLEAIAFQVVELVELLRENSGLPIERMRVDGGAAANDLLMQIQADLAGLEVERPADLDATARGAAMLAGLAGGLWPRADALPRTSTEAFKPEMETSRRERELARWRAAVQRVL